jgi:hypothetical protein
MNDSSIRTNMLFNGAVASALACFLAGCATAAQSDAPPRPEHVATAGNATDRPTMATVEPARVVMQAAESAPKGTLARTRFVVQATGAERDLVYLNSERDYRDQRSLTVVITPPAARALAASHGADLRAALEGKTVTVTGVAKRVTVWFHVDGRKTDKYYYQTHLLVHDARQLEVGDSEGQGGAATRQANGRAS